MKTFSGNTWVYWVNYIILQWFLIRLGYNQEGEWFILSFVAPLTGWGTDYVYVKKCKLWKIWRGAPIADF